MGAARGALTGALVLIVVEVLVTPSAGGPAAGKVGGAIDSASKVVASFLSPAVPGIPDRNTPSSPTATSAVFQAPADVGPNTVPTLSSPTNPGGATYQLPTPATSYQV